MTLSKTMQECINYISEHGGTIHRFPGGFWSREGFDSNQKTCDRWFGVTTIKALERRGFIEFTEWKNIPSQFNASIFRLPITARLITEAEKKKKMKDALDSLCKGMTCES